MNDFDFLMREWPKFTREAHGQLENLASWASRAEWHGYLPFVSLWHYPSYGCHRAWQVLLPEKASSALIIYGVWQSIMDHETFYNPLLIVRRRVDWTPPSIHIDYITVPVTKL